MILPPCPFAQSIAAYMMMRDPTPPPLRKLDKKDLSDAKIISYQERPVERKGLGENVDTYV